MRAKEYLKTLQKLDTVINQKIEELGSLRTMSGSIGGIDYSKDRVQTSPSGDAPFVKMIGRIVDLEEEINREVDRYVDEKHKIINQIQGLSTHTHIQLLYKRYVEFKKFETIAIEMCFTYQYTIELHGYALQDFERTYENQLKPMKSMLQPINK